MANGDGGGILGSLAEGYGELESMYQEYEPALSEGIQTAQEGYELYEKVSGQIDALTSGSATAEDAAALQEALPGTGLPTWLSFPTVQGAYYGNAGIKLLQELWKATGIQPVELRSVAGLDPMTGFASADAEFGQLSPEDQRRYFANQIALAYFATGPDIQEMQKVVSGYFKRMSDLGWCETRGGIGDGPKRVFCKVPTETGVHGEVHNWAPVVSIATGPTPTTPGWDEVLSAMKTLYAVSKGETPAMQIGQQTAWAACLDKPEKDAQVACLEQYQGQPGVAEALQDIYEPWRRMIDPTKTAQKVEGIDGKTYGVVKLGSKFKAIELSLSMTLKVGLGAFVVGGAAIGGYWLLFTKKGKRFRKRNF